MAGSFKAAFAQKGLVSNTKTTEGIFLKPIIVLSPNKARAPIEPFVENATALQPAHKQPILETPFRIGSVLSLPIRRDDGELDYSAPNSDVLVTGNFLNRHRHVCALSVCQLTGIAPAKYYPWEHSFDPAELGMASNNKKIHVVSARRIVLPTNHDALRSVAVKGSLDTNGLWTMAHKTKLAMAHGQMAFFGGNKISLEWASVDLHDIVPSHKPVIVPGSVIGCYFPDMEESSGRSKPGAKFRPAIVCKIHLSKITGEPVALDLIPTTTKTDKVYPHDHLFDSTDFSNGKINDKKAVQRVITG